MCFWSTQKWKCAAPTRTFSRCIVAVKTFRQNFHAARHSVQQKASEYSSNCRPAPMWYSRGAYRTACIYRMRQYEFLQRQRCCWRMWIMRLPSPSSGEFWELASRTIAKLEHFVCLLYRQNVGSLDIARHRVFVNNFRIDSSLPPTQDEFLLHAKRVNYQAAIHRRAVSRHICAPTPGEHGWIVEDDSISVLWMTKPIAPECLLQNAFCSCQKNSM